MSYRQRCKVGVLGHCNSKQESIHQCAGLAAHTLWNTMHRRQVCIWFGNLRHCTSGGDPHSRDLPLSCTVVALLRTVAWPAYPGLAELAEIEARVPNVVDDIFRSDIALFNHIDVANQGVQRVWVRAPLHIARKNVRSLNWRPFLLPELWCGTHKELFELAVDLSCVEHRTRHCVPLLVDIKTLCSIKARYWCSLRPLECTTISVGFPLGIWCVT